MVSAKPLFDPFQRLAADCPRPAVAIRTIVTRTVRTPLILGDNDNYDISQPFTSRDRLGGEVEDAAAGDSISSSRWSTITVSGPRFSMAP